MSPIYKDTSMIRFSFLDYSVIIRLNNSILDIMMLPCLPDYIIFNL